MRIWRIAMSGVLAAVLLFTAVVPAIAAPESLKDKVPVQFQNKTGGSVVIILTGPATVYLTLNTGKTKSELIPGRYNYSYFACGITNTGIFKVKPGATLALPKCKKGGGAANEAKQKITNNTGGTLTIVLSGPKNYTFYVATGKQQISLLKGKYNYTIYGCGGAVLTGTRKLPGGGNWVFWCY